MMDSQKKQHLFVNERTNNTLEISEETLLTIWTTEEASAALGVPEDELLIRLCNLTVDSGQFGFSQIGNACPTIYATVKTYLNLLGLYNT